MHHLVIKVNTNLRSLVSLSFWWLASYEVNISKLERPESAGNPPNIQRQPAL